MFEANIKFEISFPMRAKTASNCVKHRIELFNLIACYKNSHFHKK